MLSPLIADFESGKINSPMDVTEAKNGLPTASENGMTLHSKYAPDREAQQAASKISDENSAAVFLSCGLGYAPIAAAKKSPSTPIVIVEASPVHFFQALSVLDWSDVIRHPEVIFAIGTDEETAASLIRKFQQDKIIFFSVPGQIAHAKEYFSVVTDLCKRNRQKEEVNTNTLEKFAHLWLSNSCKNLPKMGELGGVSRFFDAAQNLPTTLPFIIIAAGPSLEKILPKLPELKKRAVLVCVDTALHSCLEYGVEPDFVILVDPQYACALHLEFLASPSSILITESAAWPSVFRFPCKEILLCSSLFPIGQYFEKIMGKKGELGAGGSVTTTAWDFARKCGAGKIYIAGMDLGFPGRQTHIRGSQFEERAHRTSMRLHTAETDGVNALLGANPKIARDYNGNEILTDSRMSLFSWWFETSCGKARQDGQLTYTLTPESMAINGIEIADCDTLCSGPDLSEIKRIFFERAEENKLRIKKEAEENGTPKFEEVFRTFVGNLRELKSLSKKGRSLCEKGIRDRTKIPAVSQELKMIDSQILSSKGKDAAALVFPTQRQLDSLSKNLPEDEVLRPIYFSKLIYTELEKAVNEYIASLSLEDEGHAYHLL